MNTLNRIALALAVALAFASSSAVAQTYGGNPSIGGGSSSSSTVAAPDYETQYKTYCSQVLGTGSLSSFVVEFGSGHTSGTFGGTGSFSQQTISETQDTTYSVGGTMRQATGTTANSTGFWESVNVAGRAPIIDINHASVKFCRVARMRVITAVDAQTSLYFGSPTWRAGVLGNVSTTKFAVQIGNTLQASVTSTVSIDTLPHNIVSWHDGTHACIIVDPLATTPPETAQCITDTSYWPINGGASNSYPLWMHGNGTTAADREADDQWLLIMVQQ